MLNKYLSAKSVIYNYSSEKDRLYYKEIDSPYEFLNEDQLKTEIFTEIIQNKANLHIIKAPCGWGKSVQLLSLLQSNILKGRKTEKMIVFKERIVDVLPFELGINIVAKYQDLIKSGPIPRKKLEQFTSEYKDIKKSLDSPKGINKAGIDINSKIKKPIAMSIFSFQKDFCFNDEAKNSDDCKNCSYEKCRVHPKTRLTQSKIPLLIRSHKSFDFHSFKNRLYPKDQSLDFQQIDKRILIFDEKPLVGEFIEFDEVASNPFDKLRKLASINHKLRKLINDIENKYLAVKERSLESINEWVAVNKKKLPKKRLILTCYRSGGMDSSDKKTAKRDRLINELKKEINAQKGEDYLKLLEALKPVEMLYGKEKVLCQVEYNIEKKRGKFHFSKYNNHWEELLRHSQKVLILDATAELDPDYSFLNEEENDFFRSDINVETSFSNTNFYTFNEYISANNVIEKFSYRSLNAILKNCLRRGRKKILLITTVGKDQDDSKKNVEDKMKDLVERFKKENPLENIKIAVDHYNNLKGSNKYNDFDSIIFSHIHSYPHSYYLAKSCSLNKENPPLTNHWTYAKKIWDFKMADKTIREAIDLKWKEIFSNLVQDIMRIKIRSDNHAKVDIYLPCSEKELTDKIKGYFSGSKIRNFKIEDSSSLSIKAKTL